VLRLRRLQSGEPADEFNQALYEARVGFRDTLDNDLHVPRALAHLFTFVRVANRLGNEGRLSAAQIAQALEFLGEADGVLGVLDVGEEGGDPEIQKLVDERDEARIRKDFAAADGLRKQLLDLGVVLADGPEGTTWHRQ